MASPLDPPSSKCLSGSVSPSLAMEFLPVRIKSVRLNGIYARALLKSLYKPAYLGRVGVLKRKCLTFHPCTAMYASLRCDIPIDHATISSLLESAFKASNCLTRLDPLEPLHIFPDRKFQ